MKHTVLFYALLLAAHGAAAADANSAAHPDPAVQAQAHAVAHADARVDAATAAKAAAAREELAGLRTQMQTLSHRMAELSSELGDVGPRAYAYRYIGQPDRAMIGVVLAEDRNGARISAVTPDGPAARAGLRDGDIVTAVDQHPLHADSSDATLANARERLADLKEGQHIRVDYRRGTQVGAVTIEAQRREALNWSRLMNEDPEHPLLPADFNERIRADVERAQANATRAGQQHIRAEVERARSEVARIDSKEIRRAVEQGQRERRHAMPWWGLNLAPLNAGLGRYFGVDKGALVISADADSLPGLRAGDVITGVAGEAVVRPEDVMRALRDQPAGTDVPIKLLRDRKALALSMKAPEYKSIFSMPPLPPAAPAPPAPPTPPLAAPATMPVPPPAPPVPPVPAPDDE